MYEQPMTEITLRFANPADKTIWVYEDYNTVLHMTNDAEDNALVTFSRVQGIGNPGVPFSTRPRNVANVKDISV
jgi:hypothetical protein